MSTSETLKLELYQSFVYLRENKDDFYREEYFAMHCALAIKNYVDTGILNTIDTGVHITGNYVGAGTSKLTIDYDTLYNGILDICTYMWDNRQSKEFESNIVEYVSSEMAKCIKESFTKNDITGVTIGTITTPIGATSPYTAQIKGTFNGNEIVNIHDVFIKVFNYMWNNRNSEYDGDLYFADEWAKGIDLYFKSLTQTLKIDDITMATSSCIGNFT